jgi:hypothetical protein
MTRVALQNKSLATLYKILIYNLYCICHTLVGVSKWLIIGNGGRSPGWLHIVAHMSTFRKEYLILSVGVHHIYPTASCECDLRAIGRPDRVYAVAYWSSFPIISQCANSSDSSPWVRGPAIGSKGFETPNEDLAAVR